MTLNPLFIATVASAVTIALVGAGYIAEGAYVGLGAWLAAVGFGIATAITLYAAHYLTTIGATWRW